MTDSGIGFSANEMTTLKKISDIQAGESIDTLQRNGDVIENLNELSSRLKSSVGYFTI